MKKTLIMLLFVTAGIFTISGAFAIGGAWAMDQSSEINVEVNNRNLNLNKPAFLAGKNVMIPIKHVLEAMGVTMEWLLGDDCEDSGVRVEMNELSIYLDIDSKYMGWFDTEGTSHSLEKKYYSTNLDTTNKFIEDELFVPLSAFDHIRTVNMNWNKDTNTVSLSYNILSRLNGLWVDETFVNPVEGEFSIVKNGKPIMFSISDEKLEYILAREPTISESLKVSVTDQDHLEIVPTFSTRDSDDSIDFTAKIIVEDTDEIQTIKYISNGTERTFVRYTSYESMVHQLTMRWISFDWYFEENSPIAFIAKRLLIKESLIHNEDMIEMRNYDEELETFVFEHGRRTDWLLELYEIKENNQKGDLRYKLFSDIVERSESEEEWENPFVDVSESDWFYRHVEHVVSNNYLEGTSETTFEPNALMTRGMFIKVLASLDRVPRICNVADDWLFDDVPADNKDYAECVYWAKMSGLITGINETHFYPDEEITRQDIAVILMRYMRYLKRSYYYDYRYFTDENEISEYAEIALRLMYEAGIINEKDNNTIDPKGTVNRSEVAVIIARFDVRFKNK